jgi:predicted phosphoribosyltransferase
MILAPVVPVKSTKSVVSANDSFHEIQLVEGMGMFLTRASVVLIDDGLASGFTMKVAVEALKNLNTQTIIVAVPTAHEESMNLIRSDVQAVFCPNVRSGLRYAVAEAYENRYDVDESEVKRILKTFPLLRPAPCPSPLRLHTRE